MDVSQANTAFKCLLAAHGILRCSDSCCTTVRNLEFPIERLCQGDAFPGFPVAGGASQRLVERCYSFQGSQFQIAQDRRFGRGQGDSTYYQLQALDLKCSESVDRFVVTPIFASLRLIVPLQHKEKL